MGGPDMRGITLAEADYLKGAVSASVISVIAPGFGRIPYKNKAKKTLSIFWVGVFCRVFFDLSLDASFMLGIIQPGRKR